MGQWTIEFYQDVRGRRPVTEFIKSQPSGRQAVLVRVINLLEQYGPSLSGPHTRHVDDKVWELRAGAGRVFYFAHTGRRLILLHAYIKKSQRAPRREIETALRRLADVLEREQ